ncbi:MAG: Gfo/Idh/MocA family oxidoreductase [Lentisphaeria bacterium]|jgi:predicted dehydrogenase
MERPIRWGILGTGAIARKFAADLLRLPGAELAAVGSRTTEAAERFGAEFAIPRRHGSYAGLAADPEVDVVYVATTNQLHREEALLCLDHGKAVLCEKPFALNLAEAEAMAARARHRGLFLMEAMWTRFFPAIGRLEELLQEGAIGELRQLDARFGFRAPAEPHGRLFDPALGGGALLDVGVYPVALAQLLFGREPARIAALAHHGPTGVDEQAGILCLYDRGELATLACAIRTQARNEAALYGTSGMIRLPDPFWRPERLILARDGQEHSFEFPTAAARGGHGYGYEAAEVMRCLREGRRESPRYPLATTLAVMRTLDRIRECWNPA